MKSYSIIRAEEYNQFKKLTLEGNVLDVGGSRKSGYHELVGGIQKFSVVNLDESCEPDHKFNIEEIFPLESDQFDHSICLNVLEHVYDFTNVFSEMTRCTKSGGKIVVAVPFMHHIHGSPDDYIRYTESALRKMAQKHYCEVLSVYTIGNGLFSLIYQSIGGSLPTNVLRQFVKNVFVGVDRIFNRLSKRYRRLSARIPLGYFVVYEKR